MWGNLRIFGCKWWFVVCGDVFYFDCIELVDIDVFVCWVLNEFNKNMYN